jgi:hypothetical protein
VRLFDAGGTVAAVARALGLTRQAVSQHLRAAGRDPAAAARSAARAAGERFRAVWDGAADLAAAAAALGLTEWQARWRAVRLRRRGVPLKALPPRPRAPRGSPKADAVAGLHRRGVPVQDIVRRTGACLSYVFLLLRRLRGRPARPRWSPGELARLGKESDAEVAARTGRTLRAVRKRRRKLGIPPYRDGQRPMG